MRAPWSKQRGFPMRVLELRTAALVAIAVAGVLAGAYAHRDRSVDDQIWLLPYESVR